MVVFLRTWYVSLHWEIVSSHKRYSLNLYDFHSSEQMLWLFSYYFVFHWRKSYRFGITRGWVNDSFFEWTIPLKLILSDSYSSTELFHSKSARWRLKFKLCAICYKWWHISFLICFICYYYYDFFPQIWDWIHVQPRCHLFKMNMCSWPKDYLEITEWMCIWNLNVQPSNEQVR